MQREPVESSSLRSVGYDPVAQTLEVEFRSGGIYRYLDVPPETFTAFLRDESLGRYFVRNIRNTYECWRLVRRAAESSQSADGS
jgi:hypothetical protein